MFSQYNKNLSKEETLFEKVYRLSKEKNDKALAKIVEEGCCLNVFQNGYTPIMLLAKEGDTESVEFLINKFGASLDEVAYGYALGGHADKVEDLLTRGADLNWAVQGYARGGHADRVENLLTRGASLDDAVGGYARGGHADKVEDLLTRGADLNGAVQGYTRGGHADRVENLLTRGADLNWAVQGYARGGYADRVENLLTRGASLDYAVCGYARGGYLESEKIVLRILTFTKDVSIRQKLAEAAKNKNASLEPKTLLRESAKLNQLMKENQMDFNQAQSLLKPWLMSELHIWFLQGIQLVKERGLPLEIFIRISSFVVGHSYKETGNLFNTHFAILPKKLFDVSINDTQEKFNRPANFWSFNIFGGGKKMTKKEYLKEQAAAKERYKKRLTF